MKAVLSTASESYLRSLATDSATKRWIYLGKDEKVYGRLKRVFVRGHEECDYARSLYGVSVDLRKDFVTWIDGISFDNAGSAEWLLSLTASKNPFASRAFLNVCYFFVLKSLSDDKRLPDLVIVDSKGLMECVQRYFGNQVTIVGDLFSGLRYRSYYFFRSVYFYFKSVWDLVFRGLNVFLSLQERAPEVLSRIKNIVFIRSYIRGDFKGKKGELSEQHYFPGLYDYLAKKGLNPVLLPFVINVRSYGELFANIRTSKKIVLLPEELLKLPDYWHAFMSPFRALGLSLKIKRFQGIDLSPIVLEDFKYNATQHSNIYASLLSAFGRRLRNLGVDPGYLINWAENQAIEKGLLGGMRKSFPGYKIISSQPFVVPANLLYLFPSSQDKILDLVHEKILVVGPAWRESVKTYFDKLIVENTPPLRYAYLFEDEAIEGQGRDILVLLSYSFHNCLNTVRSFIRSVGELDGFERIVLKLHPMAYYGKDDLLKALKGVLPEKFVFTDAPLKDLLKIAAIGVCGETGACVELVAKGVPVALVAERRELTMNYLEARPDKDLWRLCFSDEEIVASIREMNRFRSEHPAELQKKARQFREFYFNAPNRELWENYLISADDQ